MAIKTILFDLDDTLVVERASAEASFLETCKKAQLKYDLDPFLLLKTIQETCRKLWHDSPARDYCLLVGISSWEGLWAEFSGEDDNLARLRAWAPFYQQDSWNQALLHHGIEDISFAENLAAFFMDNRLNRHVVYPEVLPLLKQLKKSYKLGLITNGAPDVQQKKIQGAGFASSFDKIIISGDFGIGKPDPRIFNIALDQLSAAPGRTMMIGNSLYSDIHGANQSGITSVWLNRDGIKPDKRIIPDLEIKTLFELKEYLKQI